ncbi:CoA transferase [Pseudomonas sp. ZM23]|uniref:CaiB/BaiF CoA-transferase family protein n=1 Tax=Pseudomonas triclosanedens TaxID=2961893 RepID=A0ABY6ZQ88_9PSED|nr:CaiB/BaiF CoA-transferase family protein [Pseudomonas triclosanedens]MCP8467606.1 CoA transferase [Pseudomonas triclosanedens]MCP8473352.1 CoA transferase [Pseudomonas triclosanedens]MCP8479381.1 CoA transferase [Pseudomonas triclosanedens]WAI47074.1 CaiB/BaiF CoA-transferase family protein [Pseudomonas triclosanedens]
MAGPLTGLKVIEMVGLGPAPFCAMLLADMGAEVIRVQRPGQSLGERARFDVLSRGRRVVELDLRQAQGVETLLQLVERADALIEGFRPGVMERLGLGPAQCQQRNPGLVYGRMTGWGQSGPLAQAAGHDINYIALAGALHAIGRAGEKPVVPHNYIGDFGGGGMLLAFGVLCALLEARQSGRGQVVDAAMTDGTALLSAMMYGFRAAGRLSDERGVSLLDGGAHFYDTYECADGRYIALGAIEPQFYAELLRRCGIDDPAFQRQMDASQWPALKDKLTALFLQRSRAQWCELLEGSDACFAPVLDWAEAAQHPHNRERGTYLELGGVLQPAPAPRFSRTSADTPTQPRGEPQSEAVLRDWGVPEARISALKSAGVI